MLPGTLLLVTGVKSLALSVLWQLTPSTGQALGSGGRALNVSHQGFGLGFASLPEDAGLEIPC